jgi:glycosyltransferase involved in cell wall biosynthesis
MTGERGLVILQLAANRWWTGSADPVIQLSRGLRQRGHRVLLGLIPGGRFEDKAREAGIEPVAHLSLEARLEPWSALRDIRRLKRLMVAEGVEIIHTHHSHDHWLGWLGGGGATLVRTFHNARAVSAGWAATTLYRRTDALVAVSDGVQARCRAAGLPGDRLWLADPVVDAARFSGAAGGERVRKEFGIGTSPLIGCVARLAPERGHEALIRGFALVLAAYPDARLLLVGKGENRARLESFVSDLGLDQQVLFAGYRDADLPAVLDALDAFVLMAAGSDESCRAALEAMAAGRPVVAPRVGALPRAVLDGATGLLLDDDRPESVAAALGRLLGNPERARDMGEAGRRRVIERYTPDRHAAQAEAMYRQILARRPSKRR